MPAIGQGFLAKLSFTRINRVTGLEAGQYVCKAENEAGSTEGIASLVIQEMPSIQMDPARSDTVKKGEAQTLRCIVKGDPVPTVKWQKLGV